jgi:sarcosine oxidase subunit alpha
VADVAKAVARGLRSVEHVKRATYIGTTIDQGRTSGVLTAGITNRLLGWQPDAQGPSNARPPAFPVPFAALAGLDGGPLLDPIRTTPIHPWHVTAGAVFEDVGQWKRPRFYPRSGETMDEAVARECRALRTAAGVLDASTLGKIEVVGPDAGGFLDRMYTNRMSSLPVGTIRYGLMLGLDGMVVDDGVAMRLADDRFLVTTTTGGAAMVQDRFEDGMARDARVLHQRHGAVGGRGGRRPAGARPPRRRGDRPRPDERGLPLHDAAPWIGRRRPGARLSRELHR